MKILKYAASIALVSGAANAQGLFDINPNETEKDALPLQFYVGAAVGYDSNVTPGTVVDNSSAYVRGYAGLNFVARDPRTHWDINAQVGMTEYLDDVTGLSDSSTYNARLALNLNHRISNRLRYVTRNFVNYGLDLNSSYGLFSSRQNDEYLYLSTDHAIGYRWTERLATYTGINYSLLDYDGSASDVDRYSIYNQFRYSVSPQTTLTARYAYNVSDFSNGTEATSHNISAGLEHKLSPVSRVTIEAGASFRDSVTGESSTNPFVAVDYVRTLSSQMRARAFVRYGVEDTDTIYGATQYGENTTLRVGGALDYDVAQNVTLTVGGNYSNSDLAQKVGGGADADWSIFNAYVGANYRVNQALSVTGSVNFTTSSSDTFANRDYDRTRYELGLRYTF